MAIRIQAVIHRAEKLDKHDVEDVQCMIRIEKGRRYLEKSLDILGHL